MNMKIDLPAPPIRRVIGLLFSVFVCGSASASEPLLNIAANQEFPDSPHRVSGEHNLASAMGMMSLVDPQHLEQGGSTADKRDFARALSQMATGYMQLGADALAVNALQSAGKYSDEFVFELAEAQFAAGQSADSLATFDKALSARPDNASGATSFAFFLLMDGNADRATAVLRNVLTSNAAQTDRSYAQVLLVIAAKIAHRDPGQALGESYADVNEHLWPAPLRDVLLKGNTRDIEFMLKLDKTLFQDRLCEALFYVGFAHEIEGKVDLAKQYYNAALNTRAAGIRPYVAARMRLSALVGWGPHKKEIPPNSLSSVVGDLYPTR
jgi:tetratricopeptide (TPR) repeat protein